MPGSSQIGFVLAIEGFPYLVHSGGVADNAAVIAAWAGTGWTQAIPGLKVRGTIRQQITPWQQSMDVPTLTFEVQSDAADTFGKAVWHSRPTYRTRLRSPYRPDPDGTGLLDVDATIDEGGLADNALYLGGQRLIVAQASATQYTVLDSGNLHPFAADVGNRYARSVEMPAQQSGDAAARPMATSQPTAWTGRYLGLYLHTIRGGAWNLRAQASLEFAGRITELQDRPKDGATIIGAEDLRAMIRDSVLFKRQWVGRVKRGINLQAGWTFRLVEQVYRPADVGSTTVHLVEMYAKNALTVVASGASGAFQLNAGYMELGDFVAALNNWAATNSGWVASPGADPRSFGRWSFEIATGTGVTQNLLIKWSCGPEDGIDRVHVRFYSSTRFPLDFLGFLPSESNGYKRSSDLEAVPGFNIDRNDSFMWGEVASSRIDEDGASILIESPNPPYVVKPFQDRRTWSELVHRIDLENQDGEWVNHTAYLPSPYDTWPDDSEQDWSFIKMGDRLYFGKYEGTFIDNVSRSLNFAGFAEMGQVENYRVGKTIEDDDDRLDVEQVVVLLGTFTDLMTKILVSTDGRGVNHPYFDAFPRAIGGPSMPWSLLGDPWLESCRALDQMSTEESTLIFLDKPRRFMDLFLPELLMRFAWLIFKNGSYQLLSPPSPNPFLADWTLTEFNKAAPASRPEMLLATTDVTKQYMVNVIKVQYNRVVSGAFTDELIVRDETSISEHGESQAGTIQAVNSYHDAAGTGASVQALAATLAARVLPAFSRPMKTVQRVIAPELYDMVPTDTVSLSDNLVRNTINGVRGLVSRGVTVLAVAKNYGHEGAELYGQVTLLMTDEDRMFPYAPSADVDIAFSGTVDGITFTDGYADTAAGGPALKLVPYRYSKPIDDLPDASHFRASDRVRVYEIDPELPGAPVVWDRQLAAANFVGVANSWIRLTAELVSPAWDGTVPFRVTYQRFSEVEDHQQDRAYQCDTDGLLEDEAEANTFAEDRGGRRFDRTVQPPNTVPYRIPSDFRDDDGRPFETALLYDHMVNINNLVNYTCAQQMPQVHAHHHFSNLTFYTLVNVFPFFYGLDSSPTARRVLLVAPILQTTVASSVCWCRITSSKFPPYGGAGGPPKFVGPKKQIEFSRTGSTADVVSAQQLLTIVPGDWPGQTWISVELRTNTAGSFARFLGFNRLYLSVVEVPLDQV